MGKRARSATKSVTEAVKSHPVRSVGLAAGVVLGAALLRKAANTAAKVVTIKAVAGAATDLAGAVRPPGRRRRAKAGGARKGAKSRTAPKA